MLLPFFTAVTGALAFLLLHAPPAAAQDTSIYACVNSAGGARLVSSTEPCKSGETWVHWSIVGPQGPAGPQGVAGAQGIAGPQGAKGDAGLQGVAGPQGAKGDPLIYRGAYDSSQTYATNDIVVFGGSAYLAIAPVVGPPDTDFSWTLLVEKGERGPAGPSGSTGSAGPIG